MYKMTAQYRMPLIYPITIAHQSCSCINKCTYSTVSLLGERIGRTKWHHPPKLLIQTPNEQRIGRNWILNWSIYIINICSEYNDIDNEDSLTSKLIQIQIVNIILCNLDVLWLRHSRMSYYRLYNIKYEKYASIKRRRENDTCKIWSFYCPFSVND